MLLTNIYWREKYKMAEGTREADTLEKILSHAGLATYIGIFRAENIRASDVCNLTNDDMSKLGITTVGDRVRLREIAKKQVRTYLFRTKYSIIWTQGIYSTGRRPIPAKYQLRPYCLIHQTDIKEALPGGGSM